MKAGTTRRVGGAFPTSRSSAPISVTLQFDPQEMARRGRIGAYARLARHDARELTAPARSAFLGRFEEQVDPERVLPAEERQRRAEYAKKAYFSRLARASAIARSGKKGAAEGESAAQGGR